MAPEQGWGSCATRKAWGVTLTCPLCGAERGQEPVRGKSSFLKAEARRCGRCQTVWRPLDTKLVALFKACRSLGAFALLVVLACSRMVDALDSGQSLRKRVFAVALFIAAVWVADDLPPLLQKLVVALSVLRGEAGKVEILEDPGIAATLEPEPTCERDAVRTTPGRTEWWPRPTRGVKLQLLASVLVAVGAMLVYPTLLELLRVRTLGEAKSATAGGNHLGTAALILGLFLFFRCEWARVWTSAVAGLLGLGSAALTVWALVRLHIEEMFGWMLVSWACCSVNGFLDHSETRALFTGGREDGEDMATGGQDEAPRRAAPGPGDTRCRICRSRTDGCEPVRWCSNCGTQVHGRCWSGSCPRCGGEMVDLVDTPTEGLGQGGW